MNNKNSELRVFTEKEDDYKNVLITGDASGRLCLWRGFDSHRIEITEVEKYEQAVTHLLYGGRNRICVLLDNGVMEVRSVSLKDCLLSVDLTSLDLKLESLEILDLIKGATDEVFLASSEGEVVRLSLQSSKIWDKTTYVNKVNAEQISAIVRLKGDLSSLVLVERQTDKLGFECQTEKLIFVGGAESVVYGFSAEEHELVDKWSVGDAITAMDTFVSEEGGITFAFGTRGGKIMLRFDWEEHPKHLEFAKCILHMRFSPNGNLLAALCENQNLYLFSNTNGSYFEFDPKSFFFENEIPLSLNFFDNSKAIIVGTASANYYKLELPDLRNKDKVQDIDKFDISTVVLRYPLKSEQAVPRWNTFLCGQQQKFVAGGDQHGFLFFWKDAHQLKTNSGVLIHAHTSMLTDLKVSTNKVPTYT